MIDESVLQQSIFLREWIESNVVYFKLQYPHAPESELRKILEDIVIKHTKVPRAYLFNDYQDDTRIDTDLLKLYDWYKTSKPIAAGNGTFFYNHDKKFSPVQKVIDNRIKARKDYQKIRDQYINDITSYDYRFFDMMQAEAKIKINSIYGSFGAPSFQLYNLYTSSSTTGTAQSLISTTGIAFEAFLSDNVKFKSLDECINLIGNVVQYKPTEDINMLKFIKDPAIVFTRFKNHFTEYKDEYTSIIMRILNNLSPDKLTRLYYINNLYALCDNSVIQSALISIFNKTSSFRNPNNVPPEIQDDLELIWNYCNDFVFYNHAFTERINRLKNDKRQSVTLIDTDSNIINIDPWVEYLTTNIIPNSKTTMELNDQQFCSVNTLAYLITQMVRKLLDKYCDDCNVLERYWPRINMKNEFYFPKLLLSQVKKRYIASIRLKEGKEIFPPKIELKGHDFKKAGVNEDIEHEIMKIIQKCIIDDELVNIPLMLQMVDKLEDNIRKSIRNRERTYLIRMNCKSPMAYKEPMTEGAVTGPIIWNTIYTNNEILIPDKLDVVFLKMTGERDLAKIEKDFPREASIIRNDILNSGIPEFKKGFKYLALPNDGSIIPEWAIPIIDEERIVARNIGTFSPILKALGFHTITSGDNEYASNILNV